MDMRGIVHNLLEDKPEYERILLNILAYEKENAPKRVPESYNEKHDTDYDIKWGSQHVNVQGSRLNFLAERGILDIVYSSGQHTDYVIQDREALENALTSYKEQEEVKPYTNYEIPDDIFSPIVGYEETKKRFHRALKNRSVLQSILLVGPTASAKTIFVDEVSRVGGVARISGKSASQAGFEDVIRERPAFIIIDEFDELQGDIYSVLLNYQDSRQPFTITKSGKRDKITIEEKAPVFATANRVGHVAETNLDRFWRVGFERYSREEFEQICSVILPRDYGVSEDLAGYISQKVRGLDKDATVRDAERIAEVSDSREDVDKEISFLNKHGLKRGNSTL